MDLNLVRKDFDHLCRFCLSKEECIRIFNSDFELNDRLSKLLDVLLAKINEDDGLPNKICMKCVYCVEKFVEFEATCEKSYDALSKALNLCTDNVDDETGQDSESIRNEDHQEIDDHEDECYQNHSDEYMEEYIDQNATIERLEESQMDLIDEQVTLSKEETENAADHRENSNENFQLTNEQQEMMDAAMEVQASGFVERGNRKVPLVECIYCKNVYRGRNTLKKHLRIHLNIKDNQCAYCPKTFTDRSSLRIHQGRHTGKSFKCSQCGKSYFSQNELRQHLTMQHMERRYTCETCNKKFPSKTILNDHYRVHLPERPFVCKECGAGFKRNRNLVRHRLIHQKATIDLQTPLSCQLCDDVFDQPATLRDHLIKMHESELDSIRNGTFECIYCNGNEFSDLIESLNHQQIHYTSAARSKSKCVFVSCSDCGKKFKSRSAAMEHMPAHKAKHCYKCSLCENNRQSMLYNSLSKLKKEPH